MNICMYICMYGLYYLLIDCTRHLLLYSILAIIVVLSPPVTYFTIHPFFKLEFCFYTFN